MNTPSFGKPGKKVLGRGLSALIPDTPTAINASSKDYFICPVEQIVPQPGQPRQHFDDTALQELVASIREQGIVQPLIVRQAAPQKYVLIAGERRWRAAQRAGLHEVPVVIRNVSDTKAFEMALVENIQRADLNPVEEAEAYQRLIEEHRYTQEQLAERLGKDRTTITNTLRLLRLPQAAQRALIAGQISAGHARALLTLELDAGTMARALSAICDQRLSVRQTEELVKKLRQSDSESPIPKAAVAEPSANVKDLQERLSRSLATRVRIHDGKNHQGRIEIAYSSLDELDRLLKRLS